MAKENPMLFQISVVKMRSAENHFHPQNQRAAPPSTSAPAVKTNSTLHFPKNRLSGRFGRVSMRCMALSANSVWYIIHAPIIRRKDSSIDMSCQLAPIKITAGESCLFTKLSGRAPIFTTGAAAARSPPARNAGKNPVRFSLFHSNADVIFLHLSFCYPPPPLPEMYLPDCQRDILQSQPSAAVPADSLQRGDGHDSGFRYHPP